MRQSGTEILGAFGTDCYWCPNVDLFHQEEVFQMLVKPFSHFYHFFLSHSNFLPVQSTDMSICITTQQNMTALSASLCKDLPHSDSECSETQRTESVLMRNGWWSDKQLPCQMSCPMLTREDDKSLYRGFLHQGGTKLASKLAKLASEQGLSQHYQNYQ